MRSNRLSWARARRYVGLMFALVALAAAATTGVIARTPERAGAALTSGYWLVGTDGGVFSFGQAGFHGSTGAIKLNQPIVGTAPTATGRGYWMIASDGGIFAFGDALFYGSMGGSPLNKPIVAMSATKSGKGYWLVAADGGIFAFGDAGFFGSMGGEKLNKPIVDIATTPTGRGYWMTATDGGIFAFGDAAFQGSTGNVDLVQRIHAMAATPSGRGYWMVAGDGGIFAFGDAKFHGAPGGSADKRVIDIAPSSSGQGYYVTTSSGKVFGYGDAKHYGDTETEQIKLNNRIATMAAMNGNEPPVAVDDVIGIDEDTLAPIDLLANDRDPDGGAISLRGTTPPAHGTASPVGRSALYRPTADFFGTDSFTYTIVDDRGDTATARVTVTIKSVDDKPKANPDDITALEDTAAVIPILANDTGLGDGLDSLEVTKQPGNGKAEAIADGTVRYTPDKDFTNPDGGESFEYEVKDNDGDTSSTKVTVKVLPTNDLPVAFDDVAQVKDGNPARAKVLENDDPGDGRPEIRLVDPATGAPTEAQVQTSEGSFVRKNGEVEFDPAKSFTGNATVQYVVVDDGGTGDTSNPATVTYQVANVRPQVQGDTIQMTAQSSKTGTLRDFTSDREGDPLTFHVEGNNVTYNPQTGEFTFGPVGEGRYEITFRASDPNGTSDVATLVFEVVPPPTTTTTSPPPP